MRRSWTLLLVMGLTAVMVGTLGADQKGQGKRAKGAKGAAKKAAAKKPPAPSTENAQRKKFTVYGGQER